MLNDNLTLLSYGLEDPEYIQLQLVNDNMRLCVNINTTTKKADVVFLTGDELDEEEFALMNEDINY
ncbi:MAG: hypothetical protein MSS83_00270 [Methanobrevibacter sp.]|uniref:hypothetical protein n=1 Tax=Methanobrevibacter sp. TaxID=66852 RepID=UPI0031F55322|nr:hypothetical protein [Methanobrevibacter sp.]